MFGAGLYVYVSLYVTRFDGNMLACIHSDERLMLDSSFPYCPFRTIPMQHIVVSGSSVANQSGIRKKTIFVFEPGSTPQIGAE